jgi:hypothetical protein
VTLVVAGVLAAASIVFFWLNRPEWAYCIEAGPHQGCETGEVAANAIVGTIAAVIAVAALGVGLNVAKRRPAAVTIGIAAFAVLLLVGWALQLAPLEEVPMPVG